MSGDPAALRVRWTMAAAGDLEKISAFIGRDNPSAAARLAEEIVKRSEELPQHPYSGGIAPTYPRARFLVSGQYLTYYTVDPREIVIRAVVHGARQFRTSWMKRR
ncbi:MAG: type II toxin-antitoxin system RelE/ParE family toxin [Pirellulaceae bacterium]